MAGLTPNVFAYIKAQQLIRPGAPVIVAVSGGPDSLGLLHLLHALQPKLGCSLHVAHLDHMIRGAESAAEARFVADTARDWGLPATIEAADVPALARARRLNLHAAARAARYTFLARLALSVGAQAVAVAHHAGDQAETVLLHLLRGAGPEGMRGMRPQALWSEWRPDQESGRQEDEESGRQGDRETRRGNRSLSPCLPVCPTLIRPLLQTSREEIERYCAEQGLAPQRDPSNFDLEATRNRIRHDLLPRLIEYNPQIVAALGRTAAICADDHDFVRLALQAAWPRLARDRDGGTDIDGAVWRELHPALQRAAIRRAYARLAPGETLGLAQVERARELARSQVGRVAELPGGVALTVGYGGSFTLGAPQTAAAPQLASVAIELPAAGRAGLGGGWAIELARRAGPPAAAAGRWEIFLDAEQLAMPLVARRRRPGDRMELEGGSRRLQDLFVDAKTPRALRDAWPVVATPAAIVWVAGLRGAAQYRATAATKHILHIAIRQDGEPSIDTGQT